MLKRYEIKPEATCRAWAIVVVDTDRGFFAAVSSLGSYAYVWPDTGEPDFRSFLIGLQDDPDYLHGKLMSGRPNRKVYDAEATHRAIRERFAECRRGGMGPEAYRDEMDLLKDHGLSDPESFSEWAKRSTLRDAAEMALRRPEPDCWAFCTRLFPQLCKVLRTELAQEEADRETGWGVWVTPLGEDGFWLRAVPEGNLGYGARGAAMALADRNRGNRNGWTYEARKLPPEVLAQMVAQNAALLGDCR